MKNKKGNGILIGIAVVFAIFLAFMLITGVWVAGTYNGIVTKDVSVEKSWGNVQSAYERRLDLLPNLAATVKGSADFEKETLVEVAKARGGMRVANNPAQLEAANQPVMAMMAGMLTYAEQYPNIKSTEAFKGLMDELAGTENRIKFERDNYNTAVQDYKTGVRTFPANLIAGMFGFESSKYDMFVADNNASKAPTISFE